MVWNLGVSAVTQHTVMHPSKMGHIDVIFDTALRRTFPFILINLNDAIGRILEIGELGNRVLRGVSQANPDQAGLLGCPVLLELCLWWDLYSETSRDFGTPAIGSIFPPVVRTPKAIIFHPAKRECRSAMGAQVPKDLDLSLQAS
jgi:hypothetical protein